MSFFVQGWAWNYSTNTTNYFVEPTISGSEVIVGTQSGLDSLDLTTGIRLWRLHSSGVTFGQCTPPTIMTNQFVVACNYNVTPNNLLTAVFLVGTTGQVNWISPLPSLGNPTLRPLIVANQIFISHNQNLYSFELATGTPGWTRPGCGCRTPVLLAEANLLLVGCQSQLQAITLDNVVRWNLTALDATLCGSQLLVTQTPTRLVKVNVTTGQILSELPVPPLTSRLSQCVDSAIVATTLLTINITAGAPLSIAYSFPLTQPLAAFSPVMTTQGVLVLANQFCRVLLVNPVKNLTLNSFVISTQFTCQTNLAFASNTLVTVLNTGVVNGTPLPTSRSGGTSLLIIILGIVVVCAIICAVRTAGSSKRESTNYEYMALGKEVVNYGER